MKIILAAAIKKFPAKKFSLVEMPLMRERIRNFARIFADKLRKKIPSVGRLRAFLFEKLRIDVKRLDVNVNRVDNHAG